MGLQLQNLPKPVALPLRSSFMRTRSLRCDNGVALFVSLVPLCVFCGAMHGGTTMHILAPIATPYDP